MFDAQDKAANLLITAGNFLEAVELCQRENVLVTEEMAEQLTLAKSDDTAESDQRNALLERVADCCLAQGSCVLPLFSSIFFSFSFSFFHFSF